MNDEIHHTCLSSEPHDDKIKDHLAHFLGCIEISERYSFLEEDSHRVWKSEVKHHIERNKHPVDPDILKAQAQEKSRRKRERWKSDCHSELRRIDFLRRKLENDKEDCHLVENLKRSGHEWKTSSEFTQNIGGVRKWRVSKGLRNDHSKLQYNPVQDLDDSYDPERDINVPFMEFEDGKPLDDKDNANETNGTTGRNVRIWGRFPDRKTTVRNILHDDTTKRIIHKDYHPKRVKYFHFPSNNMQWAEEAVARYFGEVKPDFHNPHREVQRAGGSEAAMVLKESHWRGQLHGARHTTNSRFMRPFCELVSSKGPRDAEAVPQNLVMFMPYLHWETTRNRARFAELIDDIVYNKEMHKERKEKRARRIRQEDREELKRSVTAPKSSKNHPCCRERFFKKSSNSTTDDSKTPSVGDKPDSGSESTTNSDTRHFSRSRARAYTMGTIIQLLGLKKCPFKTDKLGRVEVANKLGQYLIDAARLYEGIGSYRDKKLLDRYLVSDSPLHPRRTLDQAYYWSLNNTRVRDRDQVVYRATTPSPGTFHTMKEDGDSWVWKGHETLPDGASCADCAANIKKVSRVVMVDQLWMWILDSRTIITCFPKRYGTNKHDSSGVHKSIRMRIKEARDGQIKSAFDLALIILEECSNTFFDRTRTSDKQPQVLDIFSESIGSIMHRQTSKYEKLWRWTERAREAYQSKSGRIPLKLDAPLLDINPEGQLEKEIMDIIDELGIMIHINKQQKEVLNQFTTNVTRILDPDDRYRVNTGLRSSGSTPMATPAHEKAEFYDPSNSPLNRAARENLRSFKRNSRELMIRVEDRIDQLEELKRSAETTAESVKNLLDLKSQQAGVVQAWQSGKLAEQSAAQGQSIMMFTIFTIVFLPLSFMSSVFGMNNNDLAAGNNMTGAQQFTYMFSISAPLIIVTLFFSLNTWARAAVWYVYERSTTWLVVRTKLYRGYLWVKKPSADLYVRAMEKTDSLKGREVHDHLERKKKRAGRSKKSQGTALTQPDIIAGISNGRPNYGHESSSSERNSKVRWWNCGDADNEDDIEQGHPH